MSNSLTDQQWKDIRTLHEEGGMRVVDAAIKVSREKRRIRAPTMAELTKLLNSASHKGASNA